MAARPTVTVELDRGRRALDPHGDDLIARADPDAAEPQPPRRGPPKCRSPVRTEEGIDQADRSRPPDPQDRDRPATLGGQHAEVRCHRTVRLLSSRTRSGSIRGWPTRAAPRG